VTEEAGLLNPLVQAELVAEAIADATVGVLVWDDSRRYIAANACACRLLGTTLDELIGSTVGGRTVDGEATVERVARTELSRGRITAERFDGSGPIELEYVTFATRAAGLPYMASVIWKADP
jgi:PAS domain-containing protein